MTCMSSSWLKVEERLTSSRLVFVRGVDKLNVPSGLFKLQAHSSGTHAYLTRHARGLFTIHKSRTDYGRRTVLHRAITTWNSIPHQVTDSNSRSRSLYIFSPHYETVGTEEIAHVR
jgi:hypothetical protein